MSSLNFVISIIRPLGENVLNSICAELDLPVVMSFPGRGTAPKNILDFLGLESTEKRIFISIADAEKTARLIREQKQRIYMIISVAL